MKALTLTQWLSSGEYLPAFMRDFHDAKNLFKRLDQIVQNRIKANAKEPGLSGIADYPNWIQAQVYVVDIFLWYMASRGYTLQRTRKHIDTVDIAVDLQTFRDELLKQSLEALKAR